MEELAVMISQDKSLSRSVEDSKERTALFSDFAVRFAVNYGEPLGDARASFFRAELQDVDTGTLSKAFTWVLNNCKRYGNSTPTLADIREGVKATTMADALGERRRQDYLCQRDALPAPRCADCNGTGWRTVETRDGRLAVHCKHDGSKLPEYKPVTPPVDVTEKLKKLSAEKDIRRAARPMQPISREGRFVELQRQKQLILQKYPPKEPPAPSKGIEPVSVPQNGTPATVEERP